MHDASVDASVDTSIDASIDSSSDAQIEASKKWFYIYIDVDMLNNDASCVMASKYNFMMYGMMQNR